MLSPDPTQRHNFLQLYILGHLREELAVGPSEPLAKVISARHPPVVCIMFGYDYTCRPSLKR